MPSWPVALPSTPFDSGLSAEAQDNVERFRPDVGPPKARRRYTKTHMVFEFRLRLPTSLVDDLKDFFHTTLADGSLEFTWDDPLTEEASETFLFLSPIKWTHLTTGNWEATAKMMRTS